MPSDLSPSEKENREVERLVHKRAPHSRKYNDKHGPKYDNRRRRMKNDDPDLNNADKDLSLNRKTQGSLILNDSNIISNINFQVRKNYLDHIYKYINTYSKIGETSNENYCENMSKKEATYHGVIDQRGNPIQTTNTGYKSFHNRNFTEDNYKSILAYANALFDQPWIKYGWDGSKKDAQVRAALDLAIHLADDNLYQSKIDVDTYNLLYARLTKSNSDTFSETVIPVQDKVNKRKSSVTAMNSKEYGTIVKIANDLRKRDPVASLSILKNLRDLFDSSADHNDRTIRSASGRKAGSNRVAQKPWDSIEFTSLSDDDFKKFKQDLKNELDQLLTKDDIDNFLSGFDETISTIEKKTTSSINRRVPVSVLIKLASSSEYARRLLGPVIMGTMSNVNSKKKLTKSVSSLTKKDLDW